jgi:hypothetical protein
MTTLKDYLKDFGEEMFNLGIRSERHEEGEMQEIEDKKEGFLDELTLVIKERIIG